MKLVCNKIKKDLKNKEAEVVLKKDIKDYNKKKHAVKFNY